MKSADIGLIGLAVMGENLALNMESRGYTVAVFNRSIEKVDRFVQRRGEGKSIIGTHSLREMVSVLKKPRKLFLMVRAGTAVDSIIEQLIPLLEPGDIIMDGGNSNFHDTIRRTQYVESKNLLYMGVGVSGGEEGALHGPSLMPGGSQIAWEKVKSILQSISAKVDGDIPCCCRIGSDGAGHFVKMIHNGIEYGDMQLICEAYQLLRDLSGLDCDVLHKVFGKWNETELNSYLIEITRDIFGFRDGKDEPVVEKILDVAGQKGTGKWIGISALDEGVPLTLISEAVFARCLSAMKDERGRAATVYKRPVPDLRMKDDELIEDIRLSLYASKIISYAQGYSLMKSAAKTYGWELDYGRIAQTWRGGCIIRSAFLGKIKDAYDKNPDLENLILDDYFRNAIKKSLPAWRRVAALAVTSGIPIPAMASALEYFDGYTTVNLPANLLQAQRDYFGAHTYERIDRPRGMYFHTDWAGLGGSTVASNYNT